MPVLFDVEHVLSDNLQGGHLWSGKPGIDCFEEDLAFVALAKISQDIFRVLQTCLYLLNSLAFIVHLETSHVLGLDGL